MKKYVLLITILNLYLGASVLDFVDIKKAENAYKAKDYQSASKFYSKVDNDEARYNQADTLYRQKKYKEALEVYKSIKDEKLKFKKLHNMGNSYANLNKIDEAIKSYEDALKIEQDKDTKYNLELLKKRKDKEDKKKKKDKDKKDKQKDSDKKEDKKDKDNKQNKEKQKQEDSDKSKDKNKKDSSDKESKKDEKQKPKKSDDKKEPKQKEAQKDKKQEKASKEGAKQTKQPPISNMEERKWQKMLNQRGVNTLMIPLNSKGEQRDEKNPW